MWPFGEQPIEIPRCPDDHHGRWSYLNETLEMVSRMDSLVGVPWKFREFNKLNRTVKARLEEVDASTERAKRKLVEEVGI